jgi:hypothetical protein
MKHLRKTWVRLFVCILFGAILAEIFHVIFRSDKLSNFIVFSTTVFSFSMLTLILRVRRKKETTILQSREDILDA